MFKIAIIKNIKTFFNKDYNLIYSISQYKKLKFFIKSYNRYII